MPFPYVDRARFELETPADAADLGISEGDFTDLVDDVLKAESERVESYCDDQWRSSSVSDVPYAVRSAVIRLARTRLNLIREDGLSSESMPSGRSQSYRPPDDIRAEVKQALVDAGLRTDPDTDEFWSVTL